MLAREPYHCQHSEASSHTRDGRTGDFQSEKYILQFSIIKVTTIYLWRQIAIDTHEASKKRLRIVKTVVLRRSNLPATAGPADWWSIIECSDRYSRLGPRELNVRGGASLRIRFTG